MGKKGRSILKLVDLILAVLSFCAAVALVVACLSPFIDPRSLWYPAFFGLFFPVIYMVNIVFALYWACRWRAIFFLCTLALLAGVWYVPSIYKPSSGGGEARDVPSDKTGTIKVMTFNVEGFLGLDGSTGRTYSTLSEIADFMAAADPDIICIQEYQAAPGISHEGLLSLSEKWPYHHVLLTVGQSYGTAVYSKYRIVLHLDIPFEDSNSAVTAVLIPVGGDTLRVINNHLESTHVDRGNLEFLESPVSEFSGAKREIASIGRRLKRSFVNRAVQADSLAMIIGAADVATIVCGDFNDTPVSYAYRTIRGDYIDAFREKGEGMGYTFKRLYRMLRIDYVLCSPGMEVLRYESPDVPWSDHNPVIVTLRL